MVGRRAVLLTVVALAVAGLATLVLVRGDDSGAPTALPTGEDGLAVRTLLTPRGVLFGDPVVARVDIVVDRERVDPDALGLDTQFAPFLVRRQTRERSDYERFTQLRFRFELDCLEAACVPDTFEKPIQFPQAIVTEGQTERAKTEWPLFLISARVRESAATATQREWRAVPVLRPATYRASPTLVTASLVVAAVLLLAVATAALAVGLRGVSLKRKRRLTALERALAVLEQAHATGAAEEQRLALDRLADELRETGAGELAVSARRLAWAEEVPALERTTELSDGVRELLHGRRNGDS